jgi:hypothetical protein
VQHGDTSVTATNRFNKKLLDMGITMKQEGLQSIADGVGAQIRAKNQKNVVKEGL